MDIHSLKREAGDHPGTAPATVNEYKRGETPLGIPPGKAPRRAQARS